MRRALVVGVHVGERVGAHRAPLQLAQDAPARLSRSGVDQHVAHEVDVDRVPRPAVEQEEAVGDALHQTSKVARSMRAATVSVHGAPSKRSRTAAALAAWS